MKKMIIMLFVVTSVFLINNTKENNKLVIPEDSIRFRIIANSNIAQDQALKYQIKDNIMDILVNIESDSKSISQSRQAINKNIPYLEKRLDTYNIPYKINYGNNYFPEKNYKNVTYNSGNYESLVITLGDGLGDNWWCVLFPPLCLIEAQDNNLSDVDYEFYFQKILANYN